MPVVGEGVVPIKADLSGLEKGIKNAGSGITDKLGKIGKVAGAAFAAAGVGAGAALFKIGGDFDEQFDKIRVGTGATGEALAELEDSFKNVLTTVPASFEDAGSAIADLNTRLGLTGEPLEALATEFLNLSRITGTDLATNVDNLTRTFGDWGIDADDQAETMDKLYRAAQASGIGIDELSTSLVTFGAPMRNLGFTMDEGAALLAQFNKTGVNTETVFAGLKAGVGKLAKSGEAVPETFRRVVDEITKMGPGAVATATAIELFGQRAGPDLADAIHGGKFELEGMLDAIENGEDTIGQAAADTADFSEKWQMFKNKVLVGLQPLAAKVFDGIAKAMDVLIAWWDTNGPQIVAGATKVKDAIMDFVAAAVPVVRDFVQTVLSALSDWWKDNGATIIRFAEDVRDAVLDFIDMAAPAIEGWVTDNLQNMADWWDDYGPVVIGLIEDLRDALEKAVEKMVEAVQFVVDEWDKFKVAVGVAVGIMIPHWVGLATAAVVSATKQAAAWAVTQASAIKAAIVHSAQVVAMIAKWALIAVTATAKAAIIAAAWLISIGPIALVVLAIAGLAYAFIENWDTIRSAVLTGVMFVVDKFLWMVEGVVGAAAKAFGWVPGVGDKLRDAADATAQFREDVNRELAAIRDKTITISFVTEGGGALRVGGEIQAYHSGGLYKAPAGEYEGLAMLRDGERVLSPSETKAYDAGVTGGAATGAPLVNGDYIVQVTKDDDSIRRGTQELRRLQYLGGV